MNESWKVKLKRGGPFLSFHSIKLIISNIRIGMQYELKDKWHKPSMQMRQAITILPLPILFIHIFKPGQSIELKFAGMGLFSKGGIPLGLYWSYIAINLVIALLALLPVFDAYWNCGSLLPVVGSSSTCHPVFSTVPALLV